MKILNVITDSNIGGAGIVLLNYLKYSNKKEFTQFVAVPRESKLIPKLREAGAEVIEIDGIAEKSMSFSALRVFGDLYKKLQPDIVHTHAAISARVAARLYGKCAIAHTRHSVFPQSRYKTEFPVRQILGAINNNLSDAIIAVSPAAADNLIEIGANPRKIITIYNGVEPARVLSDTEKKAVRIKYGISDNEFVCAVIARLVPEKGHDYVLDAAEKLQEIPVKILIAGTGGHENTLKRIASEKGLNNVVFTGFVEDIAGLENILDVQINASYGTEATSLSLLEGMSLGIPAVATDFGGNPFVIKDGFNGFIVPQKNGAAIAETVRKLYDNPDIAASMKHNALDEYEKKFHARIMAKNIEDTYRDLFSRH